MCRITYKKINFHGSKLSYTVTVCITLSKTPPMCKSSLFPFFAVKFPILVKLIGTNLSDPYQMFLFMLFELTQILYIRKKDYQ